MHNPEIWFDETDLPGNDGTLGSLISSVPSLKVVEFIVGMPDHILASPEIGGIPCGFDALVVQDEHIM